MAGEWFKTHRRQLHLDFHMPEFPAGATAKFNADAMADQLQRAKVNLVALFAKDHFGNAFYDTRVGHKHCQLKVDYLKQAAVACRQRGMRTLGYYSVGWDKHAWDHNPSWRHVDAQGKWPDADQPWNAVCLNSPYKDELMMRQIEEIARYPIDGLFLDTPAGLGLRTLCYCQLCRRKWRKQFGVELPADPPVELRDRLIMRTIEQWLTELRAVLQRVNPQLVICLNTASQPHVMRRIKQLCEIGVWESQPHDNDYLMHSFAALTARNDLPMTQVMTVRFHESLGDLTLKPAAQLMTECAAMVAAGMPACVGDQMNVDGTLEPAAYDTIGQAFSLVERYEPVLADAQPVKHALVLLPTPDETLPMLHGLYRMGEHGPGIAPWRGAHKMLVESHVPCDLGYSVLVDDLERWPVVVLPEPCAYQPDIEPRLTRYVEQGGTLVVIGAALLRQGKMALESLLGLRHVEPVAFSTTHFLPSDALRTNLPDFPLQLRGQAYKVIPDGARTLADLYFPQTENQPPTRAFRSNYPPPSDHASGFPFATMHAVGKGRAVYVAGSIFEIYWKTCHHWLRQFMANLLDHVGPGAPLRVDAPGTVESHLTQRGSDLLLALVRYAPAHQGAPGTIAAIERADPAVNVACMVRVDHVREVVLEPEGRPLAFTQDGPWCRFLVDRVEYLSVVRVATGR